MSDVLTQEQRRHNMQRIRRRNTKPEMHLRRGLHARGYRYRVDYNGLPGRPDLALPKYKAVIFVHGCFWHGHNCPLFKWPKTRQEFWRNKIESNQTRDKRVIDDLQKAGWRVLIVWECALRGTERKVLDDVLSEVEYFLKTHPGTFKEISGTGAGLSQITEEPPSD
ncbi:very short patch repair endonuclease [Labrenzia sp. OB1]|uniref:very short patch repair endonuclease n=1 Tax=Labrenzia sp. OB1 TaxID=1561204 RepID=UPI0007B19033|nr:very short patch repair endonuclease [Labrenzia sp. OB1]KZM49044.1 hypothetical protein OA90_17380 [Labrenzia sp. OB1]